MWNAEEVVLKRAQAGGWPLACALLLVVIARGGAHPYSLCRYEVFEVEVVVVVEVVLWWWLWTPHAHRIRRKAGEGVSAMHARVGDRE